MDVAIFDFTLVTVAMVTGKERVARSYKEYSKHNCKLLCELDISRLTPVRKCGCPSQNRQCERRQIIE